MKKILIIGPFPNPTTGVSLSNKVIFDNFKINKTYSVDFVNTSYSKFDENLGVFSVTKLFFYLKLNFFLYKVFKTNIVYITPGQTFFGLVKYAIFIILAEILGKELIVHVHGNHLGKEYVSLNGIRKSVFKKLISKTTKGIVLSESLIKNMSPFIKKDEIFVLYNFVEDYLFSDEKTIEEKLNNPKPKIIFLSNLMKEKGIFDLLEALRLLEEQNIDYEAKIAGNIDIKHKDKIEEYFTKLKKAKYCGVVSGKEKKELLTWGNIFVLPTYYEMEGQPISILEAMATRNLILTTNHAGIPDIFKEGINGFFVDKKTPLDIADKIKMASKNPVESNLIRNQNFLIADKNYRVSNFMDNFIKIIND